MESGGGEGHERAWIESERMCRSGGNCCGEPSANPCISGENGCKMCVCAFYSSYCIVFINILFRNSKLDGDSRFPRIEEMPHFHYDSVDFSSPLRVSVIFLFGEAQIVKRV